MTIDHIVPEAKGGKTAEENLWLACFACNSFKGSQTAARDAATGRRFRLYNPRKERWAEHFTWSRDGTEIIG